MDKITQGLLADMYLELQQTTIGIEDKLQLAERSFYIVEQYIQKLKEFIATYSFSNSQEEIRFFKEIKPQFIKELIYFSEIFYIEASRPNGSEDKRKVYYEHCLVSIEVFFERNQQIYNYYRTGQNYSDENYFVRKAMGLPLNPVYTHDLDPNFSTPYSFKLGKLQAYEKLRDHLIREQNCHKADITNNDGAKKSMITWTDSQAALIELAYALHSKGAINFGNISVKQLISELEGFFNIRLGNVYTVLLTMGLRKKGRTPYLRSLMDSLEDRLDQKDE